MSNTDDSKRRMELKALVEHFRKLPVAPTAETLDEYCKRTGIEPIGVGDYSDWKYQVEHDERVTRTLPRIMAVLSKLQNAPELESQAVRDAIHKANDQLEVEICAIIEEEGILYSEVDLVTGLLGGNLKQMLDAVATRIGNAAGRVLTDTAKERYGDPLTVKALGEAHRAGEKAKAGASVKVG